MTLFALFLLLTCCMVASQASMHMTVLLGLKPIVLLTINDM